MTTIGSLTTAALLGLLASVAPAATPAFRSGVNPYELSDIGDRSTPNLVDLDGDGDRDAWIGTATGVVTLMENVGTAGAPLFASPVVSPAGLTDVGTQAALTFADLDADGDLDAVVGNEDGDLSVFENTGTAAAPAFAAPLLNPLGLANVDTFAVPAFADLDGDGDLDAFVGSQLGDTHYFRNDGTASAPSFVLVGANPFGLTPQTDGNAAPAFADVDGDGDLDAWIGTMRGNVRWFPNVGTPTAPAFGSPTANPFGLSQFRSYAKPVFADLDADGDLDAWIGNGGGDVTFFQNLGSATAPAFDDWFIDPFGLTPVGQSSSTFATPTFADTDGDGDLDVWSGRAQGSLYLLQNVGTATAPAFAVAVQNPFGLSTLLGRSAPAFADLDADGDLDLLAGEQQGRTFYFRNDGTATAPAYAARIQNPFGIPTVGNDAKPAVADLDGDGDLDLLIGNEQGNLRWVRNDGTASAPAFTSAGTNPFGLTPRPDGSATPTFADVDEDGDLDVFVSGIIGEISFFENAGTPTAPAFLAAVTNPFGLEDTGDFVVPTFADVDGDADLDFFTGTAEGHIVFFEDPRTPPPACTAGDIDADGICDDVDVCPEHPDPAQADGDLDGEGDACDPCTNLLPSYGDRHKVLVSGLGLAPGRQKLSAGGRCVPFLETPAIDPPMTGLRLVLRDATGTTLVDTIVPAGAYDPALRAGWKMHSFPQGFTAQYKSASHPDGIRSVKLVVKAGEGITKLAVAGREGDYSAVAGAALPLHFILAIGTEPAANGQCCEMQFDATSGGTCVTKSSGTLVCR